MPDDVHAAPGPAPARPPAPDPDRVRFIYEFDRRQLDEKVPRRKNPKRIKPKEPEEAVKKLCEGNLKFAQFIHRCKNPKVAADPETVELKPREIGRIPNQRGFPDQLPFAAVLGCVDARAPVELLFGQGFDDLYIVRIAGNTLGSDCSGSLHYALNSFAALKTDSPEPLRPDEKPLRLVVALGHSDCGAVTAAMATFPRYKQEVACRKDQPRLYKPLEMPDLEGRFLPDGSVSGLLSRIQHPAVAVAMDALPIEAFGAGAGSTDLYAKALVEVAVYLNAAWSAHQITSIVQQYEFDSEEHAVKVLYGVFDPRDCRVRSSAADYGFTTNSDGDDVTTYFSGDPKQAGGHPGNSESLQPPPGDLGELKELARQIARKITGVARQQGGLERLKSFF